MKSRFTAVAIAILACAAQSGRPAWSQTYTFDKEHTNITFSWDHLGLSRQSGRILDCEGVLEFDPEKVEESKVEVSMKVASLWTGVQALDRQLKTSDFFDASRFPTMTFTSTGVKKTGDKIGEVAGDLTIMGVVKPVILNVAWNFTGEHPLAKLNPSFKDKTVSGFTATTKILRSDWGMRRGTPLTSDEIEITINTELMKKP